MNSKLQLITFLVSFIYGNFFYFLTIFNFKLLKKEKKWLQHLITVIYVFDIIIIYTILIYKLNHGYFHIYFILITILGFITGYFLLHYFRKISVKVQNRFFKKN